MLGYFIISFVIGCFVGITLLSLCVSSRDRDAYRHYDIFDDFDD